MDDFAPGGVFVLGGSGGLGSAICRAFAQAGVPIAFSYNRNAEAADALAQELSRLGVEASPCRLDATDRDAVVATLGTAADGLGGLHSVVYAGGPGFDPQFFSRTETAVWRTWLEQDVLAAINLAQAAVPHLRASHGAFAALSTYQGDRIEVRGGVSAISKAAIDRMIAVMAKEEGRYGVRANSLRCGWIRTPTNARLFELMPEAETEKRRTIPLGRLGDPEEIGATILFLCSRRAGFITGATLTADGGESL